MSSSIRIRWGWLPVVLVFLVFLWADTQAALVRMSLETLARKADLIVVGAVTDKTSVQTEGGLHARVVFAVEDSLKGYAGRQVVILQPGGMIGTVGMVVSEAAHFKPGEAAVVFLRAHPDGPHTVLGMSQGKLPVEVGAEGRKFVRTPSAQKEGPPERVPLDVFRRRIQKLLEAVQKEPEDASPER